MAKAFSHRDPDPVDDDGKIKCRARLGAKLVNMLTNQAATDEFADARDYDEDREVDNLLRSPPLKLAIEIVNLRNRLHKIARACDMVLHCPKGVNCTDDEHEAAALCLDDLIKQGI